MQNYFYESEKDSDSGKTPMIMFKFFFFNKREKPNV